jgi:hypothetical protein
MLLKLINPQTRAIKILLQITNNITTLIAKTDNSFHHPDSKLDLHSDDGSSLLAKKAAKCEALSRLMPFSLEDEICELYSLINASIFSATEPLYPRNTA